MEFGHRWNWYLLFFNVRVWFGWIPNNWIFVVKLKYWDIWANMTQVNFWANLMVFGEGKWRRNWQLLSFVLRLPLLIVAGEGGGGGTSDLLLVLGGGGGTQEGGGGEKGRQIRQQRVLRGGKLRASAADAAAAADLSKKQQQSSSCWEKRDSSSGGFSLYRGHTEKSKKLFSVNDYYFAQHPPRNRTTILTRVEETSFTVFFAILVQTVSLFAPTGALYGTNPCFSKFTLELLFSFAHLFPLLYD